MAMLCDSKVYITTNIGLHKKLKILTQTTNKSR
jgi:hypothetical protein